MLTLMQYVERLAEKRGEKLGKKIGEEHGEAIAESRMQQLLQNLIAENRYEDIIKISEDREYLKKMYQEYGIVKDE